MFARMAVGVSQLDSANPTENLSDGALPDLLFVSVAHGKQFALGGHERFAGDGAIARTVFKHNGRMILARRAGILAAHTFGLTVDFVGGFKFHRRPLLLTPKPFSEIAITSTRQLLVTAETVRP
ncbi:hypothetical protein BH11CYA1_BH11CYA1_47130 [soil metagenome]